MTRFGLLFAAALPFAAHAQDPVDIGVIRESDVVVVQKLLYPKERRNELSLTIGLMPWDVYTVTPTVQVSYDLHRSESFAFGAVAGFGYGFKTKTYKDLEEIHGVAPYAFLYGASLLGGVSWAPIYAKMNLNGARIVHFDVYGNLRGGVTVETSVIPDGGTPVAPTLSLAIGNRFFLGDNTTLKVELRDDFLIQYHSLTDNWHLNQNAMLLVGFTFFTKVKP